MTPGPNPVLFVGDLYPSRIYKVSLDGKVLGVYGQPGRNLGEFGWIHAIACPSENEIWVGELINWRVQKLVTKKGATATNRPKPARLSTGNEILVPEYITNGERITVNTTSGEFAGRA